MIRNHAEIIADTIRAVRPDWDKSGIVHYLMPLDGTLADITAHAVKTAEDRENRTPAALAFHPAIAAEHGASIGDICAWCGRSASGCRTAQRNTRLDSHAFRTVAS